MGYLLVALLSAPAAFAAYGVFFVPKSYGTSIRLTGGPQGACICSSPFIVSVSP